MQVNAPSILLPLTIITLAFVCGYALSCARGNSLRKLTPNVRPNVKTDFNQRINKPDISPEAYIDPQSSLIGNVQICRKVYVGPFASIRGDEGQPIRIEDGCNIQDGVVLHALETERDGQIIDRNLYEVNGIKHAVYIGKNVSLAHQCQVHGPAVVDENTFVGMQSFIFRSKVGKNVVIEPGALIIGVTVADGCYVPAGKVITTPEEADKLHLVTGAYGIGDINTGLLHVNKQLASGYLHSRESTRL